MKFLFLVEIPSDVDATKRMLIKRTLRNYSFREPKRNCFLIDTKEEIEIVKLKEWVIENSCLDCKVSYYQII